MGAAADLAARGLAGGAGEGGAGEHAVLGSDPAAAGVAEPGGDTLLDGGVAEDAGVAGLDEDGAFGHGDEAGGDADRAEGVCGAGVGTEDLGWSRRHLEIIEEQEREQSDGVPDWEWFCFGKRDWVKEFVGIWDVSVG